MITASLPRMIFACAFVLGTTLLVAEELIVTQDTVLDPNAEYDRIVIRASNITLDGQGAWLVGSKTGDPKKFQLAAISAENVSGVTLKNVNAKGWETGLHVTNGQGWTIEGCNFSDNFHDPEFGWGENGRRGGILLENVTDSTLRKNKANRVWDACTLVNCNNNRVEENDFSHTSNTCLKLWNSCQNRVRNNNLSYGLRIKQGEVHARDSTSVLIESGSNDNRFTGNDCTHGGDGIFIRVLNHWISTGNVFEENDCSYANNNCIEAWSPRNTWIRNKANHGSYGFWLGASDQNVLIGNEASFNGLPDGFHNSPHLPGAGHAGIVFMFGPSSHTLLRDNVCKGNNGAGIAAIGDLGTKGKAWQAFHWIIERNTLENNRWGIFLQHAEMLDLAANRFSGNTVSALRIEENVSDLRQHESELKIEQPPVAKLKGPDVVRVGEPVTFDASQSSDPAGHPLSFEWRIPPGVTGHEPKLSVTFPQPGFYRLALTVNNGLLSDLAWRDLYVVEATDEMGTEATADDWDWIDRASKVQFSTDSDIKLVGKSSLHASVDPYSGGRVTLRHTLPDRPRKIGDATQLVFWLKTRNENVPAWQDLNPLVTLHGPGDTVLKLTPVRDLLSQPVYNEAREGWTYFAIPLAGNELWQREGKDVPQLQSLEIGFDSWGAPPLAIWIDGLGFK